MRASPRQHPPLTPIEAQPKHLVAAVNLFSFNCLLGRLHSLEWPNLVRLREYQNVNNFTIWSILSGQSSSYQKVEIDANVMSSKRYILGRPLAHVLRLSGS